PCARAFPVHDAIPDLRPEPEAQRATARHYGSLWTRPPAPGAPTADRGVITPHAAAMAAVQALPDLPPGSVIVHAGCGDGTDLLWLARRYPDCELIGLDLSEGVVAARAATAGDPRIHVARASVQAPPLRHHGVDLVYSYGVLH